MSGKDGQALLCVSSILCADFLFTFHISLKLEITKCCQMRAARDFAQFSDGGSMNEYQ